MILVYIESHNGAFKKSAFETLTFAVDLSKKLNCNIAAISIGHNDQLALIGQYGITKVYHINAEADTMQIAKLIQAQYSSLNAKYLILSNSSIGKSISGWLSAKLNIGLISGVCALAVEKDGICFKRNVYSGKAFAYVNFTEQKGVISVLPNSIPVQKTSDASSEIIDVGNVLPESSVVVKERIMSKGKTSLTEAETVVSAGRGMKDPSNWPMIEELADLLNGATACSRPVADMHWRPHYEHVGQTGTAIRPNLYIAIGISGAIQHLAGVNNSRKIIVINKDPEAPFFKAADYGICGDLFEVVPKLNLAIKNFVASHK